MRRKVWIVAALIGAAAGCSSPSAPEALVLTSAGSFARTTGSDAATILAATLSGDTLSLVVEYEGGCQEHDFSLIHDSVFLESFPVQTHVRLAHEGDRCGEQVTEELEFDLSPLALAYVAAYGEPGPIIVHIREPDGGSGSGFSVQYEF